MRGLKQLLDLGVALAPSLFFAGGSGAEHERDDRADGEERQNVGVLAHGSTAASLSAGRCALRSIAS